jgi:hypothetical protein
MRQMITTFDLVAALAGSALAATPPEVNDGCRN